MEKIHASSISKRVFFPELWTEHELTTWGIENLENHKILTKLNLRLKSINMEDPKKLEEFENKIDTDIKIEPNLDA